LDTLFLNQGGDQDPNRVVVPVKRKAGKEEAFMAPIAVAIGSLQKDCRFLCEAAFIPKQLGISNRQFNRGVWQSKGNALTYTQQLS
jgi:hypothetical protein